MLQLNFLQVLKNLDQWYLALAYLKAKKIEKTKAILENLKKMEENTYKEKASILLQKLS